jgi:uncharacterized membrane protein YbaN (DUF454 family)
VVIQMALQYTVSSTDVAVWDRIGILQGKGDLRHATRFTSDSGRTATLHSTHHKGGFYMTVDSQLGPKPHPRHRQLWIILGIVGGLVVLIPVALYLLLVAAFWIGDRPSPTVGDAYTAAQRFYQAVEQHDYTSAYTDLDQHATLTVTGHTSVADSATTLAALAQASEQANGTITSYTMTDGNFEQGQSTVDITMRVTRSGGSYDVHLKISLTNGMWRIVSMDNL